MRHVGRILWVAFVVIMLVQPALAQDRKFAVRLGIVGMEPTNDSTVSPGIIRWFTMARALIGSTLSFTPPEMRVAAKVVRTRDAYRSLSRKLLFTMPPVNQR